MRQYLGSGVLQRRIAAFFASAARSR